MGKSRQTVEDAPTPRLVLPSLRSWTVLWHDPTKKKLVEETVTGHALSFPHANMLAVVEYELLPDLSDAKSMIRRVIVSSTMSFTECSVPTMNGVSEIM